jgi:hypothetical protein
MNENQNEMKSFDNESDHFKVSINLPDCDAKQKTIKENQFERIIEVIFNHFSSGLKIIGPFFAFALIAFIVTVAHSFITIILPFWKEHIGIFFVLLLIIFLYLLFSVLFNYLLAVLVRPGCTEDLRKSKYYKEKNGYEFTNEVKRNIDINYIIPEYTECVGENKTNNSVLKYCNYCKETKPLRAHHCTICGYCVFKMDHHCPWINNCVGQNNHRYFILFLTHTLIGCLYVSILGAPIFFTSSTSSLPVEFSFVCILCMTGFILLLFFNSWNWFLVFNGNTTIEYWSFRAGISPANKKVISNFSLFTVKENIFMVFGTKNLFSAVLIPSIKKLPFSGLEWSQLCDPTYKCKGLEESNHNVGEYMNLFENELLRDIEI